MLSGGPSGWWRSNHGLEHKFAQSEQCGFDVLEFCYRSGMPHFWLNEKACRAVSFVWMTVSGRKEVLKWLEFYFLCQKQGQSKALFSLRSMNIFAPSRWQRNWAAAIYGRRVSISLIHKGRQGPRMRAWEYGLNLLVGSQKVPTIRPQVGLLETCGLNPPSKPEEACRLASQKSDNLNMVISWLKKMKKGRPKNQLIRGMGLFHNLKKSKRRASSKHKSYRMRAKASVGLSIVGGVSAVGGEDGTSVPSISTTMKGLSLPRESNSK
ncbi:hypothetical protein Ancab_023089, partial [Ancistrocladus abbreviatus]